MAENRGEVTEENFRKEANWQQVILMRLNYAWNQRQTNPSQFKHGIAGAWNSLWPNLKKDLSRKIGDKNQNEKYFKELLDEVMETDFKDEFDDKNTNEKGRIIRTCEYISEKILEVLSDNGLLFGKRNRPTYGLRKRTRSEE